MRKILIADDDPAILDALTMFLTDEGYDIQSTLDGKSVQEISGNLPDLILLDIWMSGISGAEVAARLRASNLTRDIPIIMMSANLDTEIIAMEAGAKDFILKPFDIDDILAKVIKLTSI